MFSTICVCRFRHFTYSSFSHIAIQQSCIPLFVFVVFATLLIPLSAIFPFNSRVFHSLCLSFSPLYLFLFQPYSHSTVVYSTLCVCRFHHFTYSSFSHIAIQQSCIPLIGPTRILAVLISDGLTECCGFFIFIGISLSSQSHLVIPTWRHDLQWSLLL